MIYRGVTLQMGSVLSSAIHDVSKLLEELIIGCEARNLLAVKIE